MVSKGNTLQRISPELLKKANAIRAKCILMGKNPPSMARITRAMAKQIRDEVLWDEFVRI